MGNSWLAQLRLKNVPFVDCLVHCLVQHTWSCVVGSSFWWSVGAQLQLFCIGRGTLGMWKQMWENVSQSILLMSLASNTIHSSNWSSCLAKRISIQAPESERLAFTSWFYHLPTLTLRKWCYPWDWVSSFENWESQIWPLKIVAPIETLSMKVNKCPLHVKDLMILSTVVTTVYRYTSCPYSSVCQSELLAMYTCLIHLFVPSASESVLHLLNTGAQYRLVEIMIM